MHRPPPYRLSHTPRPHKSQSPNSQVGEDKHIELSPAWLEHVNHSCEPNAIFNTTTFNFEALRDIEVGDELCFFYPSTEWAMDSPFQCK